MLSPRFTPILAATILVFGVVSSTPAEATRAKRSYYGGYDMYGDGAYLAGYGIAGLVGFLILVLCCCLPCVCLAGIWFAGWFGFRKMDRRKSGAQAASPPPTVPGNANRLPVRHIQVDSSPRGSDSSRVVLPGDQVIFSAEDRYYTSSTAPAPSHRPEPYNRY